MIKNILEYYLGDSMKKQMKHGWDRLTANWRPDIEQAVPVSEIDNMMRQSSIPSFGFFFLLVMSGCIATFGLLSNSAPAIIGAMIIAPLMAPIMSLAHGLVINRYARTIRSLVTILAGVMVVVGLSYSVTRLIGIGIAGSEIMSRTQPTLLDLGIAIAAGAAAAFAYSRSSVLNSIAGVAIAVALVPPLAVVGIGLAIGLLASTALDYSLQEAGLDADPETIAGGAFLLFLTNLVAIVVSAGIVMISQGLGSLRKGLFGLAVMLGLLLLLLKPLEESLDRIYVESQTRKIAGELIRGHADLRPSRGWVETMHVRYIGDRLFIFIKAVVPKDDIKSVNAMLARLQRKLSHQLSKPVQIKMTVIPVNLANISVGSGFKIVDPDQ